MSDWDAGGEPVPVSVGRRSGTDGADHSPRDAATRDGESMDELVTELERTLRELRTEVETEGSVPPVPGRRPDRSLPRPPTPRELLRFTETYTIPTVVALLEAAIRALELLAGAIRLLDGRDPRSPERRGAAGGSVLAEASAAAGERAAETGREALARVDDALAELQRTYEGEPTDPAASRLLADARELRDEIDERLAATERRDGRERADGRDGGTDDRPSVDVDAELESLRQQAGRGSGNETDEDDDGG
jgi:hypothetical protein